VLHSRPIGSWVVDAAGIGVMLLGLDAMCSYAHHAGMRIEAASWSGWRRAWEAACGTAVRRAILDRVHQHTDVSPAPVPRARSAQQLPRTPQFPLAQRCGRDARGPQKLESGASCFRSRCHVGWCRLCRTKAAAEGSALSGTRSREPRHQAGATLDALFLSVSLVDSPYASFLPLTCSTTLSLHGRLLAVT